MELSYYDLIEWLTAPRYVRCPDCRGRGTVTRQMKTPFGMPMPVFILSACPGCKGKGYDLFMSAN